MEGSQTAPWQTPQSSCEAPSHCATLGQALSCVLFDEIRGVGCWAPLVCEVSDAGESLGWDPFGEKSSPHSANPDSCLTRDLVMPLARKGHDQLLPWHLGREGLIYSVQVQELALLPKRLYHLSGTGSELMGPSPCSQLCSFLLTPECGSRCGCCVGLFSHAKFAADLQTKSVGHRFGGD